MKDNVILIGMPGVGKSTVGVVLAKQLGFSFRDSDLLIQEQHHKLLYELIEVYGYAGFLRIENEVNTSIQVKNCVLATGGSAVYGKEAMAHFKSIGTVVYLQLPYALVKRRLGDLHQRGVALKEGQTLRALYEERTPLYEAYADFLISCERKGIREIVNEIAKLRK